MTRTQQNTVTVQGFLDAGRDRLALEVVGGRAGLRHRVAEAAMNRLGLALTGFLEYFPRHRIQILGHAEMAYLLHLPKGERAARLRKVFESRIPCLIVTRHYKALPEMIAYGEQYRTPVLRTPLITKNFINAATIVMENLMAPRMTVQGTMIEIMGLGVLLEGKAGIGKSETALALVKKGHSLVADDVTRLRLDSSGAVIGAPIGVTRFHMEIRGLGIIHVPSLFGVAAIRGEQKLDLIVTLCTPEATAEDDRSGGEPALREVLGVKVAHLRIPVVPGRDLANLVEVAALDLMLKRLGHDAAKELDQKLISVLTGGEAPLD